MHLPALRAITLFYQTFSNGRYNFHAYSVNSNVFDLSGDIVPPHGSVLSNHYLVPALLSYLSRVGLYYPSTLSLCSILILPDSVVYAA